MGMISFVPKKATARAWATFNGNIPIGPITPGASHNITSITKTGTGSYSFAFAAALPDVNYAVAFATSYSATTIPATDGAAMMLGPKLTTGFSVWAGGPTSLFDNTWNPAGFQMQDFVVFGN